MSLKNIFEDDDVDEGFHINEQYASKYDKWRRNEELQKCEYFYVEFVNFCLYLFIYLAFVSI